MDDTSGTFLRPAQGSPNDRRVEPIEIAPDMGRGDGPPRRRQAQTDARKRRDTRGEKRLRPR